MANKEGKGDSPKRNEVKPQYPELQGTFYIDRRTRWVLKQRTPLYRSPRSRGWLLSLYLAKLPKDKTSNTV